MGEGQNVFLEVVLWLHMLPHMYSLGTKSINQHVIMFFKERRKVGCLGMGNLWYFLWFCRLNGRQGRQVFCHCSSPNHYLSFLFIVIYVLDTWNEEYLRVEGLSSESLMETSVQKTASHLPTSSGPGCWRQNERMGFAFATYWHGKVLVRRKRGHSGLEKGAEETQVSFAQDHWVSKEPTAPMSVNL